MKLSTVTETAGQEGQDFKKEKREKKNRRSMADAFSEALYCSGSFVVGFYKDSILFKILDKNLSNVVYFSDSLLGLDGRVVTVAQCSHAIDNMIGWNFPGI